MAEKILIGDPVKMAQAMIASCEFKRHGDWYWEAMRISILRLRWSNVLHFCVHKRSSLSRRI
jgi:hypothetical protein